MTLTDLTVVLLLHGALTAGILGLLAVLHAGVPDLAARGAEEATGRPVRCLLAGVGTVLVVLALGAVAKGSEKRVAGFLVAGLAAGTLLLGVLNASAALGRRIGVELDRGVSPLGGIALGWMALASLFYVPLLGWLVMGSALLVGVGAAIRVLGRGRPNAEEHT
ncbi:hypothetical protein ACFL59_09295 [Planctomycetota bacterium]